MTFITSYNREKGEFRAVAKGVAIELKLDMEETLNGRPSLEILPVDRDNEIRATEIRSWDNSHQTDDGRIHNTYGLVFTLENGDEMTIVAKNNHFESDYTNCEVYINGHLHDHLML